MSRLELEQVWVKLGGVTVLRGLELELSRGELLVMVGPNGAGKTTVLKAAVGLVRPVRGSVRLDGHEIHGLSSRERAARIAWLPQHLRWSEVWPAVEVVAMARYRFRESWARSLSSARAILEQLESPELADRPVTELSGGERQLVALATLLAQEAPLLLLDEPLAHLDPAHQQRVARQIAALVHAGCGVLLVTHDLNLVVPPAGSGAVRVVGLKQGRVEFELGLCDPKMPQALSELFEVSFVHCQVAGKQLVVPLPGAGA